MDGARRLEMTFESQHQKWLFDEIKNCTETPANEDQAPIARRYRQLVALWWSREVFSFLSLVVGDGRRCICLRLGRR